MSQISWYKCLLTIVGMATIFVGCSTSVGLRKNRTITGMRDGPQQRQRAIGARKYQQHLAQGKTAEQAGQWDRAREIYQKLILQNGQRHEAYHRLGVVADHQKNFDKAHASLAEAIRLDPQNAEIWGDLGYCLYLKGDLKQAEIALTKARDMAPETARFHNNLGMVYGHLGRLDEALAEFEKVGSKADAFYNLAFVHSTRDDMEQAVTCIERCLAIDPSHKKARRTRENFQKFDQQTIDNTPPSFVVDDGVHWIPYVEGMEQPETKLVEYQQKKAAPSQASSPSRDAGNRVRQLQSRTQALMNGRMRRSDTPEAQRAPS